MDREAGFSLLEITVALSMTLLVIATALLLLRDGGAALAALPETADMHQRLRVAVNALSGTLLMAGAGPFMGSGPGPLHMFVAPVLPFRRGVAGNNSVPVYSTDTITVLYVPGTAVQTTTRAAVSVAASALRVNAGAGCPRDPDGTRSALCGVEPGMNLLICDEAGRYNMFAVTSVDGDTAQLTVNGPAASATTIYPAGSRVVQVVERAFGLRVDTSGRAHQLVSFEGPDSPAVPVVDNVVALKFEYFGDARPPDLRAPGEYPAGQWWTTTYGPRPPPADMKWSAYPEGENCTFAVAANGKRVPRLSVLGASNPPRLVTLTEADLTDGPWCPDTVSSDRFDADLLRIRSVAVTIRLQAALDALRGPAGTLFFNAGTATSASRWVPDQEVRFEVAPRNLNLGR
jgi:hypothetical protein